MEIRNNPKTYTYHRDKYYKTYTVVSPIMPILSQFLICLHFMNISLLQTLYTFVSARCLFPRQFRLATIEKITVSPNDDASQYDKCCLYMEECVSMNSLKCLSFSNQCHELKRATLSALDMCLHMVE